MSDPFLSRPWWRTQLFRVLSRLVRDRRTDTELLPPNPRRILVLAPVLLGDYLVLTPLLAGIARARPRAEIAVLTTRTSESLARVDPHVHRVLVYENLPRWFGSVLRIFRYRPDIVVFPKGHPAVTESLVMLLTRAPYRVGLAHPHLTPLLTHPVRHDWENEHRTVAFSRLLAPFGLDPSMVSRRLHIGHDRSAEYWAEQMVAGLPQGRPFFTLNLSASRATRRWTLDRWRDFLRQVIDLHPDAVFFALSAPAERSHCEALAAEFDPVHTHPTRNLLEAVALIARSDILLTVDTGVVQAAAARGVPMVVLYNGDHEVYTRFAPVSVAHRAVLAPRGEPVSAIDPAEAVHELVHLMSELERS